MSNKARKGGKKPSAAAVVKEEVQEPINEFDIDCSDFLSIQKDLNLDDETAEHAYKSYLKISNEYTLSEPITDWYACAIYTSCRKINSNKGPNSSASGTANGSSGASAGSSLITNSLSGDNGLSTLGSSQEQGNFVSLTRILRSCNISVIRFCKKMLNWSDMVKFSPEMHNKLNQLEGSFNVTTAIFKKYKQIFEEIFKCPSAVLPSRFCGKNRKNIKKQALASNDIYHFCWTFFVYTKTRMERGNKELLSSYHLLLVCIDYCFCAVLTCDNALDIINTGFYESLAKRIGKDPKQYQLDNPSTSKICILGMLCQKFTGAEKDALLLKSHYIPTLLKTMLKKKQIKKKENGYSIIDTDVIDFNFRFFKQNYETHVLSGGDFDECVYLNDNASRELGTEELQSIDINEALANLTQRSGHDNPNNLIPMTPLTSNQYTQNGGGVLNPLLMTPISSATQSVSRLQSILQGQAPQASEKLELWLAKLDNNNNNNAPQEEVKEDADGVEKKPEILENINNLLKRMCDIFVAKYTSSPDDDKNEMVIRNTEAFKYIIIEQIQARRDSALAFFFFIFEKMFFREVDKYNRKGTPEADFLKFLKPICERKIFIQTLFVCSLEVIVFTYKLRNYSTVLEIFNDEPDLKMHPFYVYKVIEPIIREEPNLPRDLVNHLSSIEEKVQSALAWDSQSPVWAWLSSRKGKAPTCQEVFPNISLNNNGAPPTPIKSELGPLLLTPKKFVTGTIGQVSCGSISQAIRNMDPPSKVLAAAPKQTNMPPFELFFRKVYLLASVRLMNICDRLEIRTDDLRKLMWTCLENAISQHTELLADRNLDQLIMCAVYSVNVINKSSTGRDIKFNDIITVYSQQPQAEKAIYKNVLITNRNLIENNNQSAGESSSTGNGEEKRGNIIDFYNSVFLVRVGNDFIMKLSLKKSSPPMSPIPNRMHAPTIQSPLRQFPNSQIFVSPLRKIDSLNSPLRVMSFPLKNGTNLSQNLGEINRIVNSHRDNDAANTMLMINNTMQNSAAVKRATKKIFQDEDKDGADEPPNKLYCLSRRIQTMVNERQILSASSSANASGTEDSNDSVPPAMNASTATTSPQPASTNQPTNDIAITDVTPNGNTTTSANNDHEISESSQPSEASALPAPPPILASPPVLAVNNS